MSSLKSAVGIAKDVFELTDEDANERDEDLLSGFVVGGDGGARDGNNELADRHTDGAVHGRVATAELVDGPHALQDRRARVSCVRQRGSVHSERRRTGKVIPTFTTFVAIVIMNGLLIPLRWKKVVP